MLGNAHAPVLSVQDGEGAGLSTCGSSQVCFWCSRTTAGPVVRATIASFLKTYTTPTSILEADGAEIEAAMNTLGLQVGHQALEMHPDVMALLP